MPLFILNYAQQEKILHGVPSRESNSGLPYAASRRTTNWATPHPYWAMPHPDWATPHPEKNLFVIVTKHLTQVGREKKRHRSKSGGKSAAENRRSLHQDSAMGIPPLHQDSSVGVPPLHQDSAVGGPPLSSPDCPPPYSGKNRPPVSFSPIIVHKYRTLIKKDNKIFLICKEIQMGAVAKSYIWLTASLNMVK